MADSELTDLTETTTPASTDILYIVVDPSGTPVDRKVQLGNLATGMELAYAERTTTLSPTATTEGTAETLVTAGAVSLDGSTRIEVEVFSPFARPQNTTAALLNFYLYDAVDGGAAASLGRIAAIGTPAANTTFVPVKASRFLTPASGSHVYSLRVATSSGTGFVGAGSGGSGNDNPLYIRVTRA